MPRLQLAIVGKVFRGLLVTGLIFYCVLLIGITAFQRKLLYFPDASNPQITPRLEELGLNEVTIDTDDNIELRCWWWPAEVRSQRAILLLHGNAGHREGRLNWMQPFREAGYSTLLLDYRGYGGSEGEPTEEGLYHDARAAADWLRARGFDRLVYVAESLGTGVAVELATTHPPRAMILHAAYESVHAQAEARFPWLPVSWILLDRYDSLTKIPNIKVPTLYIHGDRDQVIPWHSGRTLFNAAGSRKAWLTVKGAGHNDLVGRNPTKYYNAVLPWLDKATNRGR